MGVDGAEPWNEANARARAGAEPKAEQGREASVSWESNKGGGQAGGRAESLAKAWSWVHKHANAQNGGTGVKFREECCEMPVSKHNNVHQAPCTNRLRTFWGGR